jgi:hypothetical protein
MKANTSRNNNATTTTTTWESARSSSGKKQFQTTVAVEIQFREGKSRVLFGCNLQNVCARCIHLLSASAVGDRDGLEGRRAGLEYVVT